MMQTTTRGAGVILPLCRLTNQNSKPEALFVPEHFDHHALLVSKTMLEKREKQGNRSCSGDARESEAGVSMKAFAVDPHVCLCSRPALC